MALYTLMRPDKNRVWPNTTTCTTAACGMCCSHPYTGLEGVSEPFETKKPLFHPPGNNHYRMVGLEATRNLNSKVILYFHKGSCPGIF